MRAFVVYEFWELFFIEDPFKVVNLRDSWCQGKINMLKRVFLYKNDVNHLKSDYLEISFVNLNRTMFGENRYF